MRNAHVQDREPCACIASESKVTSTLGMMKIFTDSPPAFASTVVDIQAAPTWRRRQTVDSCPAPLLRALVAKGRTQWTLPSGPSRRPRWVQTQMQTTKVRGCVHFKKTTRRV